MLLIRITSILTVLVALTFSCKKPSDDSLPKVKINTPLAGQYFNVFDTLFVNVEISDNIALEWIKVDIIDEQNSVAIGAESRSNFDDLEEIVNIPLIIDDIHLETGTYHVRATVSDGTNENFAFQQITIFAAPLKRLKILAFSNPSLNTTQVDSLGENGFETAFTWNQKGNIATANSWHGEILLAAENSGDIKMLIGEELAPGEVILGDGNGSNPDYNAMEFHPEFRQYFSSKFLGQIEIRNRGGIESNTFSSTSGFRPYGIEPVNSKVIVEERNLSETITYVSSYNRSSGALLTSLALEANLVEITHKNDEIWLWGNDGTQGKLWSFDSENGFITEVYAFSSALGEMQDVTALPDGTVGIAFGSNSIMVDPDTQPSLGTLWDYGGQEIDYDLDIDEFLVRDNETIYLLAPGDNNPHGIFEAPENTFEIVILYNK